MENLKDFTEKIRDFGKTQRQFRSNFGDFPRFVVSGDRTAPEQTVLKCYLAKAAMVSVHRETNGNGFVFVNYKSRATILKNISPYETVISEDEWFRLLAEKIFHYMTVSDEMTEILSERRRRLGNGGAAFLLTTGS